MSGRQLPVLAFMATAPLVGVVGSGCEGSLGSVNGTAKDRDTDLAIDGARIEIENKTVVTDERGDFTIDGVSVGTQTISAEANGYRSLNRVIAVADGTNSVGTLYLRNDSSGTDDDDTSADDDDTSTDDDDTIDNDQMPDTGSEPADGKRVTESCTSDSECASRNCHAERGTSRCRAANCHAGNIPGSLGFCKPLSCGPCGEEEGMCENESHCLTELTCMMTPLGGFCRADSQQK